MARSFTGYTGYLVFHKGKRVFSGVEGRALPAAWRANEIRKLAKSKRCYTVVPMLPSGRNGKPRKVGRACRAKGR